MPGTSRAATASALLSASLATMGAMPSSPLLREPANPDAVTLTLLVSKEGQPISDLQPADVEVHDSGRPRVIEAFEFVDTVTGDAPEVPGDFVLLLDDLGTSPAGTGAAVSVGLALVDALGPDDRLALVNTGPFRLAQPASTDRASARATIRQFLGQRSPSSVGSSSPEPCRRSVASLSALENALRPLAQQPGTRRALLVVSDADRAYWGDQRHERCGKARTVLDRVVVSARLANVSIYAFGLQGVLDPRRDARAGKGSLSGDTFLLPVSSKTRPSAARRGGIDLLAAATGGTFITDARDLADGVHDLVRDSRQYYRLAYRAPDVSRGARRGFRTIEVRVRRAGVHVRARYHDGPA